MVSSAQYGEVLFEDSMLKMCGMSVPLKPKEAKLVRLMLVAQGQLVSRAMLLRELDYHPEANTHTVENHIYRIRNKLKDFGAADFIVNGSAERNLQTGTERGYRVEV